MGKSIHSSSCVCISIHSSSCVCVNITDWIKLDQPGFLDGTGTVILWSAKEDGATVGRPFCTTVT